MADELSIPFGDEFEFDTDLEISNDPAFCKEAIRSNEYADFLVETSSIINILVNQDKYVCIQNLGRKYSVASIKRDGSGEISISNYGYNTIPKCFGLLDSSSMESAGILKVRRQPFIDLLGRGVIIGFVDTGIDYTNSLFKNADDTTRILSIWDQTIDENLVPEGFYFGSEYTSGQINDALLSTNPYELVPSNDTIGHGTSMAGIAAGGIDTNNDFTGAAPLSSIVAVKLKEAKPYLKEFFGINENTICYQENDIMLGILYILKIATREQKPVVICLGLGTNSGDHNGNSVLSDYINTIGDYIGICFVTGAGNEGNMGHHFRGIINQMNESERVELRVGPEERGFSLEIWGSIPNSFSIGIVSPTGEVIPRIPARLDSSQAFTLALERTKIFLDYRIIEERTGDELAFIRFTDPTPGIWTLEVFSDTGPQVFDVWLPMTNFITEDTYFIRPDPNITITEPGNARVPITVATYNHVTDGIYVNSSRGNTRDGRREPDITAPGVDVFVPTVNGEYTRKTGASIASAHVAGAAALIFEWGIVQGERTGLNYVNVEQLLIRGANRNPDIRYPNPIWGFGTLDLFGSLESLRRAL